MLTPLEFIALKSERGRHCEQWKLGSLGRVKRSAMSTVIPLGNDGWESGKKGKEATSDKPENGHHSSGTDKPPFVTSVCCTFAPADIGWPLGKRTPRCLTDGQPLAQVPFWCRDQRSGRMVGVPRRPSFLSSPLSASRAQGSHCTIEVHGQAGP